MKKYKITKSQLNYLLEQKKTNIIINEIVLEIESYKKNLNESIQLNEAIVDVLKKYMKRGLLTGAVLTSLLTNNIATANDLISAGVPKDKIEQVSGETDKFSDDEIFKKLVRVLSTRGHERDKPTLDKILKLSDTQKKEIIDHIKSNIEDLKDISNYKYNILVRDKELSSKRDLTADISPDTKYEVDTVFYKVNVDNLEKNFKNNSSDILNEDELKENFKKTFSGFYQINKIIIESSSNTLRNTGNFEGLTWLQGSTQRGEAIKNIITNVKYSLGGNNPEKSIESNIVKIDATGENGDGTSGPKSPFESNEKYIKSYQDRNIPENLWKSNGKGQPYNKLEDYTKHNYVKVSIEGLAIDKNNKEIRSYEYFQMVKIQSPTFKIGIPTPNIIKGRGNKSTPTPKVGAYPCRN